jgi:5-formyltetrahydrofolate cyclo-ligase
MDEKQALRERVWTELMKVAVAESRFHYDFGEFIADFDGGEAACQRLTDHEFYRRAELLFIAPDNCIERLRHQALLDGKRVLMTTYGIRRGFWLLDPAEIPADLYLYASTLDGMERVAKPLDIEAVAALPRVDYLVTGTGAINHEGVRFGKGHGFFDAEWGMLHELARIDRTSPVAAVVHDCQVLDEKLTPEIFDSVADVIFTPTRTIPVAAPHKPECGILWDRLDRHMYETIPPLQQLRLRKGLPAEL